MASKVIGYVAAVASILAGIYLLQSATDSDESTTVFDVLMDGIGAYFVARGLWMISSLTRPRPVPDA